MKTKEMLAVAIWIAAIIVSFGATRPTATAQSGAWQQPVKISTGSESAWFPDLAVGGDGRVHLVWASGIARGEEANNQVDLLLYSVLQDGRWSKPNDIVNPGTGGFATRNSIAAGRDGKLHLLVRSQLRIEYLRADWEHAGSAQAWGEPRRINNQSTPYYDALALDSKNTLHAFWNESVADDPKSPRKDCPDCSDLFYRRSSDAGKSWSVPINLSQSPDGSAKPQIKIGAGDVIHAVWDEGRDTIVGRGEPAAVMYRRSRDGGVSWDKPARFTLPALPPPTPAPGDVEDAEQPPAQPIPDAPQQIALGLFQNHAPVIVYRATATEKVYYQTSPDDGSTWSQATELPGVRARDINDTPWDEYTMATDGAGVVHLVLAGYLAGETDPKARPQLLHLTWDGRGWSPPEVVASDGLYPEWPRAVVSGNTLHLAWFTRSDKDRFDSDHAHYQVWYSARRLDGPALAALPLFTPVPTVALRATPTPTPPPTPTPAAGIAVGAPVDGPAAWEGPGIATLGAAIFAAVGLLALVVLARVLLVQRRGRGRRVAGRGGRS